MKTNIFSTAFVDVQADEVDNIVYIFWKKQPDMEHYKEPFDFVIHEYSKDRNVNAMISDIRNQGIVGPQHRNWLQKEATPYAKSKGVICYGVISDSNIFKTYYVNTILSLVSGKDDVERKLFNDIESCEQWVRKQIAKKLNKAA